MLGHADEVPIQLDCYAFAYQHPIHSGMLSSILMEWKLSVVMVVCCHTDYIYKITITLLINIIYFIIPPNIWPTYIFLSDIWGKTIVVSVIFRNV